MKKTLQTAEPSEFFGQDFTKLGELITLLKDMELVKSDKALTKKMKSMDERNVDIVATASKLRKEYELLYRQLEDLVYPTKRRLRKMNEDVLEILKALTAKIEMLEKAVYNDDNLLMKSGLVVVESPTPSMNVQKSSGFLMLLTWNGQKFTML